jgi:hypothetical protein
MAFDSRPVIPSGSSRRRLLVLGIVLTAACAAGAIGVWIRPSPAGAGKPGEGDARAQAVVPMTPDDVKAALFAELQPIDILNCRLERFGEPHDGGYLMCANLLGSVKAGYSYGISGYDQWGCDVARRLNVRVHQYDCFDPDRPRCDGGVTVFHRECIGPSRATDDAGRVFDTFEHQFASNGDGAKQVVVKIDVEGAEWETFLQTPSAVLARIDQLVVEFHGVNREHYLAAVRRLKEFFLVAHLHINNYACQAGMDPFPAWAYEVLFVNKRIAVGRAPRPAGPHPLDAPNKPAAPDCQVIQNP